MAIPIAGISPEYQSSTQTIYESSLYLGIANQLTNILRDVEEDASRGRIYLPQDELGEFGLTDEHIFSKKVTKQWREFTKMQIQRARHYYDKGEQVASQLHVSSRWPVQALFMLYKKILDKIEENDYDNLTKRATVGTAEKFLTLPIAYAKAMGKHYKILNLSFTLLITICQPHQIRSDHRKNSIYVQFIFIHLTRLSDLFRGASSDYLE